MDIEDRIPEPQLPDFLTAVASQPELAAAWEHEVVARRAEAQKLNSLLDYRVRIQGQAVGAHLFERDAADKAALRDAALMLNLSERTAVMILNGAGCVRDILPKTWSQFESGALDLLRVRKVAAAVATIADREDLLGILDDDIAEIAAEKNPTELKHWLTRRLADLDAQAFAQRVAAAKSQRYVRIEHLHDGMSFLEAFLPTVEAVSIGKRLDAAARGMTRPQPTDSDHVYQQQSAATGDDRTLAQRRADLFSAWLRDGRTYQAPNSAKICVLVSETTLVGADDQPALGADRSWAIPASEARKLAADPTAEHTWYTATSQPNHRQSDQDILTVVFNGRFAPERLRDAVIFRDGVCQHPGCTSSAERADLDHLIPYASGGATSADNIWALCRHHHTLKSHGYLPIPAREPPNRNSMTTKPPREHSTLVIS